MRWDIRQAHRAVPVPAAGPGRPVPRLSHPGDAWEREADHLAGRALARPAPLSPGSLPGTDPGPEGRPLLAVERASLEPGFGFDFSRVRIHSGPAEAASAATLEARAFTVGTRIAFGAGQFRPGCPASFSLLAHELAHVVQQGRGAAGLPAVLRQVREGTASGQSPPDPAADLRRQYVDLICQVIGDIRRGVEEGRTWTFEDEFLLQGDEELGDPQRSLVGDRQEALQRLVGNLDEMIRLLESGTLRPEAPASRAALRRLWTVRYHDPLSRYPPERVPRTMPTRWGLPVRSERRRDGSLIRMFNSLGGYIEHLPVSPPGMLRPATFPTWWVLGCSLPRPSGRPQRVTPEALGLDRDQVIFISRTDGRPTSWQWEPRQARHPAALLTAYEWQFDPAVGRVYILVDGREYDLLPNYRLSPVR